MRTTGVGRRTRVLAVLAAVLVGACGGGATESSEDGSGTTEPSAPGETWDLVVMGDSVLREPRQGLGARFEDDLGVALTTHDWVNPDLAAHEVGGERSNELLERLRTDEDLRSDLREAELIVFDVPVGIINDLCPDPATITADEQRRCFGEVVPQYHEDVDAIFDELVGLRDPADAIVRVTDVWQLNWPTLHSVGDYDTVRSAWQAMNGAVAAAATRHGIPLIRAYDALTGPDGDRDPVAAGDVSADELHLTPQGVDRFVELVAALGYAPLR